jgi:hypothetical protein
MSDLRDKARSTQRTLVSGTEAGLTSRAMASGSQAAPYGNRPELPQWQASRVRLADNDELGPVEAPPLDPRTPIARKIGTICPPRSQAWMFSTVSAAPKRRRYCLRMVFVSSLEIIGAPDRIRTCGLCLRGQWLNAFAKFLMLIKSFLSVEIQGLLAHIEQDAKRRG